MALSFSLGRVSSFLNALSAAGPAQGEHEEQGEPTRRKGPVADVAAAQSKRLGLRRDGSRASTRASEEERRTDRMRPSVSPLGRSAMPAAGFASAA